MCYQSAPKILEAQECEDALLCRVSFNWIVIPVCQLQTRFLGGSLHNFVEKVYFFMHYIIYILLILSFMKPPPIYLFSPWSYLKSTYTTEWLIFLVIYVFCFTNLFLALWFIGFHRLKINVKSILCINFLWVYCKLFCNRLTDVV